MCRNTLLGYRTRAGAVLTVLLTSLAGIGSVGSQAAAIPTVVVTNAASFNQAVVAAKTATTIQLADGIYSTISVSGHSAPLYIQGSPNAKLAGVMIQKSSSITLSGVTVTPNSTRPANVVITGSAGITVTGIHLDGRSESLGGQITTDPTDTSVVVQNSDITNCGAGNRCLAPGARSLVVSNNKFHDCFDCDFIRGGAFGPTTISGNTFDRAVTGSCVGGAATCNHNDHIQIMGGGPWTIVGNSFGDRDQGAASVFVKTGNNNTGLPIHDVLVESNLFHGNAGFFAIQIVDDPGGTAAPKNISVINNTILSGSSSAVRLTAGWAIVAAAARPLVANNIFAIQSGGCGNGRFDSNLVVSGKPCPADNQGPANLDALAHPTSVSSLVISQADPLVAPATDALGKSRIGKPDRGAYESPF